jgi:hypothetical protein
VNNIKNKFRMSSTAKYLLVILVALIVAALIFYGRLLWYYPHLPLASPTVPAIDVENIAPELVEYASFKDRPVSGDGRVVVDLSHANNLQINDLIPLRDRIVARGATVTTFTGADGSLETQLIDATALVIIAPSVAYSSSERETITRFVDDGGLLLLAADPTRPVPDDDELASLYSAFYPTSAVPVMNSLANGFGITYYDDYLYNLEANEGNFRNVRFDTFDKENSLTKGLKTVVFFGCHSLQSEGNSIVTGDGDTLSSVRTGGTAMTAATMTTEDRVLALGDITFLTPPYNTVEDNDRFVSNIADWLAVDERLRDNLDDFPYFFGETVDVIPLSNGLLDPQMVAGAADWQEHFAQAGLNLSLRTRPRSGYDRLYVGTFYSVEQIADHLIDADITVSIAEDEESSTSHSGDGERDKIDQDHITIKGVGGIPIEGTSLYLLDLETPVTLIVLAEDTDAAVQSVERLSTGTLSGCVQADTVTLCSTGEGTAPSPADDDEVEESEDVNPTGGSILLIEDDNRPVGSRTGAVEFMAILSTEYDVTTWSIKDQGVPDYDEMANYDVYIFDSGDYAADIDNIDALLTMSNIEKGGIMMIGAQPMAGLESELAALDDLQIADALHPVAASFEADEIITLLPSESGVPAVILSVDDITFTDFSVVIERGPESDEAGTPALITVTEEFYDGEEFRLILATFAFYRLPETAQESFALDAVTWLMGDG